MTRGYSEIAAETTADGFGDLTILADNRRCAVFLRPYAFARPVNGWAWVGRPSGLPVPMSRFANLAQRLPTPFGDGKQVFNFDIGGRIMLRHVPARPEQIQSPLEIIRDALRVAATAPTDRDALDATGEALRRLADLARVEVRNG
ncbi:MULTISPECIES: hypothetical protein [Burkholderia]|uniref:hypothetical protein n=1 Tax=Burkholderia TaxID=32008 RepID=UPI00114CD5EB|nr:MULTISPECIES: hypothetical protein [Burkholderia]MBJ9682443.1 hypothetical protein [Burkholderia multivorans]